MRTLISFFLLLTFLSTYAQSDEEDTDILTMQVLKYYSTGQYEEAISTAQKTLLLIEKEEGKKNEDYMTVLGMLGESYHKVGRNEETDALYDAYYEELRQVSSDEELMDNLQLMFSLDMHRETLRRDLNGPVGFYDKIQKELVNPETINVNQGC